MQINHNVYLALGSNLGDRKIMLETAISLISKSCGLIIKESPIYETPPLGFNHENYFFNSVIQIQTPLSPQQLLIAILEIEKEMGRIRSHSNQYEARCIDIDILFFDSLILKNVDLIIPHPEIAKRKFVLFPLHDIASNFIHPELDISIFELLQKCEDNSFVKKME